VQRDTQGDPVVLAETRCRREAIAVIVNHVAHHLVERDKQMSLVEKANAVRTAAAAQNGAMLLVWLSGLTFGACLVVALMLWLMV